MSLANARSVLTAATITLAVLSASVCAQGVAGERPLLLAQFSEDPFSTLVGKRATRRNDGPELSRYVTVEGGRAFLFEEASPFSRIRFLCAKGDPRFECRLNNGQAPEVVLLSAARGPRGDQLFKSGSTTVLRVAAHGGASVAWPGVAEPMAATKTSLEPGDTLELSPETAGGAERRAHEASAALAARLGRPVRIEIPAASSRNGLAQQTSLGATPDGAGPVAEYRDGTVLADAVARAAAGLVHVARDETGARIVSERVTCLRFVVAAQPALALDGKTLIVSYNPERGVRGRPSAAEVARFLEGTL